MMNTHSVKDAQAWYENAEKKLKDERNQKLAQLELENPEFPTFVICDEYDKEIFTTLDSKEANRVFEECKTTHPNSLICLYTCEGSVKKFCRLSIEPIIEKI